MNFENFNIKDTDAIAHLHAESWRHAYRGILTEKYLDNDVFDERKAFWRKRMAERPSNMHLIIAKDHDELMGFVCIMGNEDPKWGALIDNLHVHPDRKGQGMGVILMKKAAQWVHQVYPESSLYLWVYEANHAARGFYEKMKGEMVEETLHENFDGTASTVMRYAWEDVSVLI